MKLRPTQHTCYTLVYILQVSIVEVNFNTNNHTPYILTNIMKNVNKIGLVFENQKITISMTPVKLSNGTFVFFSMRVRPGIKDLWRKLKRKLPKNKWKNKRVSCTEIEPCNNYNGRLVKEAECMCVC